MLLCDLQQDFCILATNLRAIKSVTVSRVVSSRHAECNLCTNFQKDINLVSDGKTMQKLQ